MIKPLTKNGRLSITLAHVDYANVQNLLLYGIPREEHLYSVIERAKKTRLHESIIIHALDDLVNQDLVHVDATGFRVSERGREYHKRLKDYWEFGEKV